MYNSDSSSIVKNPRFLDEDHIPPILFFRDELMKEISFCINPVTRGKRPIHVWIHGNPGTGKTVICRNILENLTSRLRIHALYINCWEHSTFYSILDKIVRELKMFGSEKINTSFKFERVKLHLGGKPLVLFFDEIDKMLSNKDRDYLLYNFSNIGNVGIIAISNSKNLYHDLDGRIKSRLSPRLIEFQPYTLKDLIRIIDHRAHLSLNKNCISGKVSQEIATLAKGDARIAIQVLRNVAYQADKEKSRKITTVHVYKSYKVNHKYKITYRLSKLTKHHHILYSLVNKKQPILSGDLWRLYTKECKKNKIKPIALRTFSVYMQTLITSNIVTTEKPLLKGRSRIFRIK